MSNTRRELKSYKGYTITKINGYRYISYDPRDGQFEAHSLKDIKKQIDCKIQSYKLGMAMGRILGIGTPLKRGDN